MTQPVNTAPPDLQNQASAFRMWVQEIWMTNREERLIYGQEPATIKQYWNTYKWWLKREYRFRQSRAK